MGQIMLELPTPVQTVRFFRALGKTLRPCTTRTPLRPYTTPYKFDRVERSPHPPTLDLTAPADRAESTIGPLLPHQKPHRVRFLLAKSKLTILVRSRKELWKGSLTSRL